MDSFDLARLTDMDFEAVCKDVFEELLDVRLEIFAQGADQGIDLRHLGSDQIIVQCKHWTKAGRTALIREMGKNEAPKLKILNPARYILATSVDLTPQAKAKIVHALKPYSMDVGDIFGLREIESELRKRPHLARRHLRLWLSSAAVLGTLISRGIVTRSAALKSEIEETLRTYVPSPSYGRANELLDRYHVCMISGIPGIGKTTLAHVILAAHYEAGYEVVEISEDAEEANRLWDDSVPQIFYYDDFLGQTTLQDKLHKNEDSRIISLLRRSHRASNKRFVLTTREYILAQAKTRYEKLASQDFDALKCVLDLGEYTPLVRAEILYNHVYFSPLTREQRAFFANLDSYWPIIRHSNFNPRLVSVTLNSFVSADQPPEDVVEALLANLSNPWRIWAHIIEEQLDDSDVHVLLCLLLLGGSAPVPDLLNAWTAYREILNQPSTSDQMRRSIRILDGTITRGVGKILGAPTVVFHNPSIRDFMKVFVKSHPELLRNLVHSAIYFEQLMECWPLLNDLDTEDIGQVTDIKDLFAERAIELLHDNRSRIARSQSYLERLTALLRMAEKLDMIMLSDHVADEVNEGTNVFSFADDPSDIGRFIRTVSDSPNPRLRRRTDELVELAVDDALGDLWTWNNCVWAESVVDELRELAPSSVIAEIEDAKLRLTVREFDSWPEKGGSIDSEIFDYATSFENAEEVFPNFTQVRQQQEASMREVSMRDSPHLGHQARLTPSPEATSKHIDTIFSSLRNIHGN
ncbi:restriction endonuclease [Micromonospora sp. LOL_021]|uniref:nSTAND3 domain-containing NTPase n=1 Tax=Micromonospora sp. LOL_021 TaxID=3345417 RepID=UPI003A8587CA